MDADVKKRFTDTEKWADRWFRPLSPTTKLLWFWLLDHCDNAGVIDPDMELCSFQIGESVNEKHFAELGDRLQRLKNGKWWIPKFVRFQFGELTTGSQIHRSVIGLIRSHKELPQDNPFVSHVNGMEMTWASPKEKDKEKEPVQEKGKGEPRTFRQLEAMSVIQSKLANMFRRRPGEPWTYAEQCGLIEVCRRENVLDEVDQLQEFKEKPQSYFPQSVERLLTEWSTTLDRSRNYVDRTKPGGPLKAQERMALEAEATAKRITRKA